VSGTGSKDGVVLVIGARSQIGHFLLPALTEAGYRVIALSRAAQGEDRLGVQWIRLKDFQDTHPPALQAHGTDRPYCAVIHLAPISALPSLLERLAKAGARRVIAFSSTSVFTKSASSDEDERLLVSRLLLAESDIARICERFGMEWTIFRPTLVYSWGHDRNVSEIGRFIRRFKLFPLLGRGQGLRQPVHAHDLARACVAALQSSATYGRAYNLAGGRTLSYRQMVEEVFAHLGKRPRFVQLPAWLIRGAIRCARLLPRFRKLSPELATRMQQDMCFDSLDAQRDFGFSPRPFALRGGSGGASSRVTWSPGSCGK
jgi:nucleoside-diphosphate-sugar epimerase